MGVAAGGTGRGSQSSGLAVAQTRVVATARYRAVVSSRSGRHRIASADPVSLRADVTPPLHKSFVDVESMTFA